MTGRYGKTDTWDNVPALGGFVTAGFVFSTTDASLRDCSTGMDATDATTDPAPDPGGAGNPSDVPAASVPATTVQTKTPNATSTVLSTATLVSTAEAQPADLETVTVTETVPAPADGADQGGHDRDVYDEIRRPTRRPSIGRRTRRGPNGRPSSGCLGEAACREGLQGLRPPLRPRGGPGLRTYSGSYSALSHWYTAPPGYRHAGDRAVPAGGLAFFGGSTYGHVMISIGGGKFVSNDINAAGRLSVTTITQIEKRWGMRYLGWSQPWFKANH